MEAVAFARVVLAVSSAAMRVMVAVRWWRLFRQWWHSEPRRPHLDPGGSAQATR